MNKEKSSLGKKVEEMSNEEIKRQQEEIKELEMPKIRTLDFIYEDSGEITYKYPELTALCPMTDIPDSYNVRIIYTPDGKIPELKSLRFYFLAYRNVQILHEHLANKIFDDFEREVEPKKLKVELEVAVRGGIYTRIVKESER